MVYVFLADGCEEIEALCPVDVLRRAGIEVKTVGVTGNTVTGSHNIEIKADIAISDAVFENLEGIILPGGMPGTLNLEKDETVQKFIDFADKNNLLIGAICAAPSILGHKGILRDKNDFEKIFVEIRNQLGTERFKNFHSHFSKIEYTTGGEKRHLTFDDVVYGPNYEPVMELVAKYDLSPTFVCESAGTQAEDAKKMKDYYLSLI